MPTWSEKIFFKKTPQTKRLYKFVSGMPAGSLMYMSNPQEIDEYIKSIPYGQSLNVQQTREDLAKRNQAN